MLEIWSDSQDQEEEPQKGRQEIFTIVHRARFALFSSPIPKFSFFIEISAEIDFCRLHGQTDSLPYLTNQPTSRTDTLCKAFLVLPLRVPFQVFTTNSALRHPGHGSMYEGHSEAQQVIQDTSTVLEEPVSMQ